MFETATYYYNYNKLQNNKKYCIEVNLKSAGVLQDNESLAINKEMNISK